MVSSLCRFLSYSLVASFVFLPTTSTLAQLELIPDTAPDRSLGTQVLPEVSPGVDVITGGTRPQNGPNLFHSFQEFNVRGNQAVYFENLNGVQNILTRITGNNPSEILGKLGVLGSANLFLINPNGIIFGHDASLDLQGGSFYGTSASGIKFGEVGEFSAVSPQPPSNLLTINPSAFFFIHQPTGAIVNQSQSAEGGMGEILTGLSVVPGQTLLLLGGDLTLDGGRVSAPGGRVELGAIRGVGEVGFNADGSLTVPDEMPRGDVTFANGSQVAVQNEDAGDIAVTANNISILSGSQLLAGIAEEHGTNTSQAGDISLNATGLVQVTGQGSQISNTVGSNAIGNGGNVKITAQALEVRDGAELFANTLGNGDAGNIEIQAHDHVLFSGVDSAAYSNVGDLEQTSVPQGKGGNVLISTNTLEVLDGAYLVSNTFGNGDAGNVEIRAHNHVLFNHGSFAFSNVGDLEQTSVPHGKGGNVLIFTDTLEVLDDSFLVARNFGTGDTGNVEIEAGDRVLFNNGYAISSLEAGAKGKGGNVLISTNTLEVLNGGQLDAGTFGIGDAGNVEIQARDRVLFIGEGSSAFSDVVAGAKGKGGNVMIQAATVDILHGGQLIASTEGDGRAGSITINASNRLTIVGTNANPSGIFVRSDGAGGAGNITVTAPQIRLDHGEISADSAAVDGGNIDLGIEELLLMRNGSKISASAGTAQEGGNGGNITINVPEGFVVGVRKEDSDISANAFTGSGGKVAIKAQAIYGLEYRPKLTPSSDITASSSLGVSGTVAISTLSLDPSKGLEQPQVNLVDPSDQIAQTCTSRTAQRVNSFTVKGSGGLPTSPTDLLQNESIRADLGERVQANSGLTSNSVSAKDSLEVRQLQASTSLAQSSTTVETDRTEAQGWTTGPDGSVYLVAQSAIATPNRPFLNRPHC